MNAELAAGLYRDCKNTLSYVPRTAYGKIVGYTVRVESRVTRVMDETGVIRIIPEPRRNKELGN